MKKRLYGVFGIIILGIMFLATSFPGCKAAEERYEILGSTIGGSTYASSVTIADMLSKYQPDVNWTVHASNYNADALALNEQKVNGLAASATVSFWNVTGEAPNDQNSPARIVWFVAPIQWWAFCDADQPWQTIGDVPEDVVWCMGGPKGSNTGMIADDILKALGKNVPADKKEWMFKAANAAAWRDGLLDVVIVCTTPPSGYLAELVAGKRKIKWLNWTDEQAQAFLATYGVKGFFPWTIPAGTQPGIDYDTKAVSYNSWYLADKDFPEDVVYEFCEVMADHYDEMVAAYGGLVECTPENLMKHKDLVPGWSLHPGTVRYLRDRGYM